MQKPKCLRPGDKVAVVSLSNGWLGDEAHRWQFDLAKARMERDYGLELVAVPNALRGTDYLRAHPEARAADMMEAFRDGSIKAVISAMGGSDTIRLLPYIDFDVLRQNPKIFMGFSDTTVNHFMLHKAGVVSYYGGALMSTWAEAGGINEYTRAAFDQTFFHPAAPLDIPCSGFCGVETRPDLPILYNVNVGHAYPIGVLALGLEYQIDCTNRTLTLLEAATAEEWLHSI